MQRSRSQHHDIPGACLNNFLLGWSNISLLCYSIKQDRCSLKTRYYYDHGRLKCQDRQRSWNMGTNKLGNLVMVRWMTEETTLILLQGKQPHIVSNILFKHKPSHRWTWTSPDYKSKNMIDFILIRDRWRSAVDNTRSFQSVGIVSDQALVLAKIRMKFKVEK